ncbi:terminase [Xenorhabdus szentirmaii]|nr:terminase [Xenorhabdus szentirmaii]
METDANANIKPNKKKSANKIDPAIAFLMSFGTWQIEHEEFAFTLSEEQQKRLVSFDGI